MNERLQIIISANVAQAQQALKAIQGEINKTAESSESLGKKASDGFTVMKGVLSNLASQGITAVISKMKDFVSATLDAGKNFTSVMSKVQAISGASADDLQKLENKAKQMGATTKFSASQSAEALNYMAMAGWKTEDMINGLDGVLNLAAASGADLATTSDIVTDALTGMGYKAEDAGRLADVMAAASSNANTNVEMMGYTFKYAAPIVGALGYSMEDTAVAIGLMANAGIKGEQAGTSLRSILTRLSAPPKMAADAMKQLGIEITNTDGTMKPLSEVMEMLRGKFKGLNEVEQTAAAKAIAGTEAMSGFLAVVNSSDEDFNKLTDAINNSNGSAQEMATIMQDNLEGDLTQLNSKLEGIQISLFEKLEPALRGATDVLSGLLDGLSWVIEHSSGFIAAVAGMTAGLAAYFAYTTIIKVMKEGWMALEIVQNAVTAAQWLMNAAMSANPIGLVIAAVAALIAIFVVLWNNCEGFREFWINLWNKIEEVAAAAWEGIKAVWQTVKDWFNNTVIQPVKNFFTGLWDGIKNTFNNVKTWFTDKFKGAVDGIKNAFSSVVNFFSGIWNSIKSIFSKVGETVGNAITNVVKTAINGVLSTACHIINGFISAINFAIGIINAIPGVNLKKLNQLQVPKMAKGGIVDSATLAVIGEQGKEAVVPLENNTEWIDMLIERLKKDDKNDTPPTPIILQVDGKTFAQTSVKSINDLTKQTGKLDLVLT